MTLPITAILCVRNEERYLRTTLSHLVRNGVRLIVIDNDSVDSTPQILDEFSGHVIERHQLKWPGHFDLTTVIERVRPVVDQIKSGWILWQDADEILQSYDPAESLRQAIERIDASGANVINFDEFVFITMGADIAPHEDFRNLIGHYYFHEPTTLRLMRAWRAGQLFPPGERLLTWIPGAPLDISHPWSRHY